MKNIALFAALVLASPVAGQQTPPEYGDAISLEHAKTIVAAAEQEARARQFKMAFAIVDPAGELILFHRMDGTQYGSTDVAREKARTAARFKRPTKVFFDAVSGGRTPTLSVPGVIAIEGGVPILVNGEIVGGLGVSGGTAEQDGEIASAGLARAR
ncbi:GlcG/HbpS family heme-binding protein [Altericroceibacterium xinjiangense]|uniref:GlcG/HbpS family heme-binding protein n=1 Tax=Altericroceibacterium xinjiangense TaxID=762261 RepID=UPI000F7F3347|nr:heme-binding protein [Altericroceibacterium xinjiangense]